jgi:hypothetical protein
MTWQLQAGKTLRLTGGLASLRALDTPALASSERRRRAGVVTGRRGDCALTDTRSMTGSGTANTLAVRAHQRRALTGFFATEPVAENGEAARLLENAGLQATMQGGSAPRSRRSE